MRSSLYVGLLAVLLLFSGCLNIVESIVIRPDGSVLFVEDATFDRMILDLLYLSRMGSDSTTAVGMAAASKPRISWDKPKADTILAMVFKSQKERWAGKSYIRSVTTIDTPTYSGVHFILTADITNYRFLDSVLQRPDTSKFVAKKGKRSKKPAKPESLVLEEGDSVRITLKDLNDLSDNVMDKLPEDSKPPMFKKLSFQPNRSSRWRAEGGSMFHQTAYHLPRHHDGDGPDSSGNSMDSLTQYMGMLSGMMSGMFSIEVDFSAPEILSADETGVIDRDAQTVTWTIDGASMASGNNTPADRYVWFRKPRVGPDQK